MSDGQELVAMAAETKANSREIERLRERNHEFGNQLTEAIAKIDGLGGRVDAHHESVKGRIAELRAEVREDLTEIKAQTKATNGHVADHDRQISKLQGGLVVVGAVLTALGGVVVLGVERL